MFPFVTIIPARGGSKGIARKNLQLINGKTLIERAIKSAQRIPNNHVYVSSDSDEILHLSKKSGAIPLKRSETNSRDESSSESVILESISKIEVSFEIITLLQATSPFIDLKGWSQALTVMNSNLEIGSMFSAVEKNEFTWQLNKDFWEPVNHKKTVRKPRQSLAKNVVETGSFYIFRKNLFLDEQSRFCGLVEPQITQNWSNFDIDTIEDLELCQKIGNIIDEWSINQYL